MSTFQNVHAFLSHVGSSIVSPAAYDAAWLAVLSEGSNNTFTFPTFPDCLEWLTNHQNDDGSWGGPWPHYHDRLISTLRAVLTLQSWHLRRGDKRAIERGIRYIWKNADKLNNDPYETVAFELIFPMLLRDAEQRGMSLPFSAFDQVIRDGKAKLSRVGVEMMYRRDTPLATSIEALGEDFRPDLAGQLQEGSGGVAISPGASAFLLSKWPDNRAVRGYLENALAHSPEVGGAPSVYPIETFERSWGLYHLLSVRPQLQSELQDVVQPLLDFIDRTATSTGWATSEYFTIKESDSTAVCFTVLRRAGYDLDPMLIYQYEEANHFRCYPFERNPSVSANIHVLDALRYCDEERRGPKIAKVLAYLRGARQPEGFWFDKWHVSPYYPTGHAVMAAHDLEPDLVAPAIDWLLHTQDEQGGWGYFAPTVEETAFALLALLTWRDGGHELDLDALKRGVEFLQRHFVVGQTDYPPLWIGKSLYTPTQVVQSVALSVLLRAEAGL